MKKNDIIIPVGHKLYHGTGEEYLSKKIKSGIDNVFWTSEYPEISSTYIPVSGSILYTNSSLLSKPSVQEDINDIQHQLGIFYKDIKKHSVYIDSYRESPVFVNFSKTYNELLTTLVKLDKKIKDRINDENLNKEDFEELFKLQEYQKELERKLVNSDIQKHKNEYVNQKLKELGYEPSSVRSEFDKNYDWKLKNTSKNGKTIILPASYRLQGRLLTIIPKRDLKILDMTLGSSIEGDLMDLDYHKIDVFKKAEELGYDGIKINDFAQIEGVGNYGHHSIGLFKNTLKDVNVSEQPAEHPKDFWNKYVVKEIANNVFKRILKKYR